MTHTEPPRLFAKRARTHTLILASGERIRHVTLRSWTVAAAGGLALTLVAGLFTSTAYLVLRDDIIGVTLERQARMQHAYEDRIAALREEIDRVTSRQLVDQQIIEEKVEKLLAHQADLTLRSGRLDALLRRADPEIAAPVPIPRPQPGAVRKAAASTALDAIAMVAPTAPETSDSDLDAVAYAPTNGDVTPDPGQIVDRIETSLGAIEEEQAERVRALTTSASETADGIEDILRETGIDLPAQAIGGPFLPELRGAEFDVTLDDLDAALTRLGEMRQHARHLPFGHPARGQPMSSRFGLRRDPFLGRSAFHAGLDFSMARGELVRSSGGGKVIFAGRKGGYGNMVEIDHGNGITSRYAHLSRIDVTEGEMVARGDSIGAAGSTGRSTGPHLHYEVRRNGKPLDPRRFLEAGSSLEPLLAQAIL